MRSALAPAISRSQAFALDDGQRMMDVIPNRSQVLAYFPTLTNTDGVSFSGAAPNVTMTITVDAPFYMTAPFTTAGAYLLSSLHTATNGQVFIVDNSFVVKIAIYSHSQSIANVKRILSYLRSSLYVDYITINGEQLYVNGEPVAAIFGAFI